MDNRIHKVEVRQRRWDPAEAELWVTVEPERVTPTTEVRGRLVGPRCPGITTIEVAYPLRPLPKPPEGASGLTVRVLLPDPAAWEPQRPYVYEGTVELWEDGRKCDQAPLRVLGRASGSGAGSGGVAE